LPPHSDFPARTARTVITLACATFFLFAPSACGKQDDGKTAGQTLDAGIAKTEQAAREAKNKAQIAMGSVADAVKQAAQDAQVSGRQATADLGGKMDDMVMTAAISAGLAKDATLSVLEIDVDSNNGVVTLRGPAPTAAAREKATEIAMRVKGVRSVENQLVIQAS
jgi:hyperosmotically inducible protein